MARNLTLSQSGQEHKWLKNELGSDIGLCVLVLMMLSHMVSCYTF